MLDCLNPKILLADNRMTLAESETGIHRRSEITASKPRTFINTNTAQSCKYT